MSVYRRRAEELVARPTESLNIELKRWLDLSDPAHAAKVVRALMALHNRNGGQLAIGFDDKTRRPAPGAPPDTRSAYHEDDVQALVSKHSSRKFEVLMDYVDRDGVLHPVMSVDPGVRIPVMVTAAMTDQGKTLLGRGEIPFRTLNSNGTPSTAALDHRDLEALMEICFENREADVGRFLRRHLGSVEGVAALRGLVGAFTPAETGPTLEERCSEALAKGQDRFRALAASVTDAELEEALGWGAWEVAVVMEPAVAAAAADGHLYDRLVAANPSYNEAWPVWGDTRSFNDPAFRPVQRAGGWETFVAGTAFWTMLEFARLEPEGVLYLRRLLDDDASAEARKARVGATLEPGVVVDRVAETMAVGLSYAKVMAGDGDGRRLGFLFRWTGLKDRRLSPWSDPFRLPLDRRADDPDVTAYQEIALETSPSALAPFVQTATAGLFAAFGGYSIPLPVIERRVANLIGRRSG